MKLQTLVTGRKTSGPDQETIKASDQKKSIIKFQKIIKKYEKSKYKKKMELQTLVTGRKTSGSDQETIKASDQIKTKFASYNSQIISFSDDCIRFF